MKRKICMIIIFAVFTLQALNAQNSGIAVEDQGFAARVNPAALGTGNSSGLAWYHEYEDEKGLSDTYSFYLNPGNFSYSLDSVEGSYSHNLGLGIKGGEGVYLGAALGWDDGDFSGSRFGLSALYRPFSFVSLALKSDELSGSGTDLAAGIGIRPFPSGSYWASRLTFYLDTDFADIFSPWFSGIIAEPVDGFKIRGEYSHEEKEFSAGITFSSRFLSTSASSQVTGSRALKSGNIAMFASARRMRSKAPLPGKILIEYDRGGVIRDFPREGFSFASAVFDRGKNEISLMEFLSDMEKIRQDPDIDAVLFREQPFITSFANISEIYNALIDLKASGKKIYFYFESVSTMQYALAAGTADEIIVSPMGSVNLKGFSRTGIYLSDFFERFGIKFYNFRSHDYKTAYNSLTESGMTEGEREALEYLYSGLQDYLEEIIVSGRGGKLKSGIAEIMDKGPYLSSAKALQEGLIDRRFYSDELEKWIKENRYSVHSYGKFPPMAETDWDYQIKPVIAIIHVNGAIVRGEGIKGETAGSDSISGAIRSARQNPLIRAIILRINSGGGSALASDIIAREVELCAKGDDPKPVIVSMGGAAASGGYYIASPADHVFADPVTITGSIGVIAIFPDFSGLLEKLDIAEGTVKRSESGDFGNIARPLTDEEAEKIASRISEMYEQFVKVVSTGRKIPFEEADSAGKGRVWTGRQAVGKSLADSEGGIADAVSYAENRFFSGKKG